MFVILNYVSYLSTIYIYKLHNVFFVRGSPKTGIVANTEANCA